MSSYTTTTNYISLDRVKLMRSQAVRVWTIGLSIVAVWLALIVAAPLAKTNGFSAISSLLYSFFSFFCHQIPERSLHIAGESFAVCSRCCGVYLGLLSGFVVYPLWRNIDEIEPLPKFWLILSLIPISIDWSLTFLGICENTHVSRFLTGMIVGVACSTFIIPALVEIARNLIHRRSWR